MSVLQSLSAFGTCTTRTACLHPNSRENRVSSSSRVRCPILWIGAANSTKAFSIRAQAGQSSSRSTTGRSKPKTEESAPSRAPVPVPERSLPEEEEVAANTGNASTSEGEGVAATTTEAATQSSSGGKDAGSMSPEELGQEIARLRQERQSVSSVEKESFWEGVLRETQMIEWPAFTSVLGTTSVVLGIILGSSVILLTLNAILAQLSDTVFSSSLVASFWRI